MQLLMQFLISRYVIVTNTSWNVLDFIMEEHNLNVKPCFA